MRLTQQIQKLINSVWFLMTIIWGCMSLLIKIMFAIILIGAFYLYFWLFPSLFTQLFSGVEKRCDTQEKCIIRLHEITSFKWDKAYFFPLEHGYGYQASIQMITGVFDDLDYDTYQSAPNTLVIFTYKNHLVRYTTFNSLYGDSYEYFPMVSGKKSDFFVKLNTNKEELRNLHYSGNLNNFLKSDIEIYYYELTPQNDALDAGCFVEKYTQLSVKQCGFSFTNVGQIHLYNP